MKIELYNDNFQNFRWLIFLIISAMRLTAQTPNGMSAATTKTAKAKRREKVFSGRTEILTLRNFFTSAVNF